MKTPFISLQWSTDWNTRIPWTIDGEKTPYIGYKKSKQKSVSMISIGPIGIVFVVLP